MITRRKTRVVRVGNVKIGGSSPISIQSMLKTKASETKIAIAEIKRLESAGCDIIRIAVKDSYDTKAIKHIRKGIKIPIVADIHFDYRLALESIKNGVDKIRINPGNISRTDELKEIIKAAKKNRIPIRIGLNSGSISRKIPNSKFQIPNKSQIQNSKFINVAQEYINFFERENFRDIIISLKSSSVFETVDSYKKLAEVCDYPFHLGVTAAGPYDSAIVKSSIGIGALLLDGIGDTIRVSLTGDALDEVIIGKRILQALNLRNFGPDIISCPTCGRCQVDLVRIVKELEKQLSAISHQPSVKGPIKVAIMGCEVNGPGEAREADIGIATGKGFGTLFKKGNIIKRIKEKNFVREIIKAIKAESR